MKALTPSKVRDQALKEGIKQGFDAMVAVLIVVMHDKYGFGKKRLRLLHERINYQWESVLEGRISVEDLLQLADEIMEDKNESNNISKTE